jgi:phage terminase large subunit-like protein
MNPVDAYARDVVDGRVPAGKYHRLACARHLKDRERERENTPEFPYRFDLARAERFYRFVGKLKHYKGEWAGQYIALQPHQKFRKGCKYGWVHATTGLRRFRNSYEEIPRKNGKSLELATETLYLTFFDGEGGAEGYTAATKREQALIIFNDCKKLVQSSGLKARLKVQVSNIHHVGTASKLEPLSADYNSMDGLNVHTACLDELHALKTRGTIDVLETATGARLQPLINKITTAGDDPVSPCGDEHDYACKILDGVLVDETYFAFIAHADLEDDWTLEETAAKANPNYGISVKADDLAGKVTKATGMPSAAATYKQKHLNLWVNQSQPWLSLDGWRAGQSGMFERPHWEPSEMYGQSCWIGIDLASSIDLCAMVAVFPPTETRKTWRLLRWVWTPQDTMIERGRRDRAPYSVWAAERPEDREHLRSLIAVEGVRINHNRVIRPVLAELREHFHIEQVGFDPWHADQVMDDLKDEDGFSEEQLILVPQTYAGMSKAALDFEAAVLEGIVDANGCPLMLWSASSVVVQRDGKDNIYPVKKKSRGRIDPIMATIIGWRLASLGQKTRRKKRKGPRVWTPQGFVPAITDSPGSAGDGDHVAGRRE